MNYTLFANQKGEVEVVKKAGSAYVRFAIPEGKAKGIIETADKVEKSESFKDFGIAINDGELYLAGELASEKQVKEEEKPADEPKADPKPERKDFGNKFHKKKH